MDNYLSFFSGFLLGVTTCLLITNNLNKKEKDYCNRYRSNNKKRHHF